MKELLIQRQEKELKLQVDNLMAVELEQLYFGMIVMI